MTLRTHRPLDLARVAFTETVAMVRLGLWPLARLHPLPRPTTTERHPARPPVVLVHGYLGHSEMLRPLVRRLLREGWTSIERVGYPSTRVPIDEIVRRIAEAAHTIGGGQPVDLVGHSLGAVACRAWIKAFDGAPHVRRFVSLGGPHAGTSLYRFTPRQVAEVLDPRGPWVARLSEGPEPVPTFVIRARYDHQVFPPRRARIPGATEVTLRGRGHNALLWSRDAHDAVVNALLSVDPSSTTVDSDSERLDQLEGQPLEAPPVAGFREAS